MKLPPEIDARERAHLGKDADAPFDGLALSGGGVRSATFCFGVLRRLAHHDVLAGFTHMSTVSGGGYIGGCLMALLKGNSISELEGKRLETHLRAFGRYLIPRQGFLGRDALRILGAILLGLAWTTLWFAGVFVLFTTLVLFLVELHRNSIHPDNDLAAFAKALAKDRLALAVLCGCGVITAAVSSLIPRARSADDDEAQRDNDAVVLRLLAAVLTGGLAEIGLSKIGILGRVVEGRMLGPVAFMFGAFVCAFFLDTAEGRRADSTSRSRSFASTMFGVWTAGTLLAAAFAFLPTLLALWFGADLPHGAGALPPTLGAIAIARFVAMLTPKVESATKSIQSVPRAVWSVVFPFLPAAALLAAFSFSFLFLAGTCIALVDRSDISPALLFVFALGGWRCSGCRPSSWTPTASRRTCSIGTASQTRSCACRSRTPIAASSC